MLRVQGVLNGPSGKISSVFTTVLATGGFQAQFLFIADAGTTFRIDDVQLDPFKGH